MKYLLVSLCWLAWPLLVGVAAYHHWWWVWQVLLIGGTNLAGYVLVRVVRQVEAELAEASLPVNFTGVQRLTAAKLELVFDYSIEHQRRRELVQDLMFIAYCVGTAERVQLKDSKQN